MKRGGPLRRSQPLERRSTLNPGLPPKRRARLKPKPLDAAEAKRRAEVRGQVYARDGFRCLLAGDPTALAALGPCFGRITPHHRQKASQGGPYTVENLVTICEGHQTAIEDYPRAAFLLGLVIRSTPLRDTPPQPS